MVSRQTIIFILSILLYTSHANLVIQSDTVRELNGNFTIVNVHQNLEDLWTLYSEVVFEGEIIQGTIGSGIVYYNISDFIFFDQVDTEYLFEFDRGYEYMIELQNQGAKIGIIREKIDPPGRRYIYQRYREGLNIPVAALDPLYTDLIFDALNASANSGMVISVLAVPDENTWFSFLPVLLTGHIILLVIGGITLSVSSYRMILFILNDQFNWNIAVICLSFNIIGDTTRLIAMFLDPYQFIIIDNYTWSTAFLVIQFPFLFSTTALTSFFWAEITRKSANTVSLFLTQLQIPFIITISFIFIFMVGVILLLLLNIGVDLTLVTVVIILLLLLSMGIFYIIVGCQIIDLIKNKPGNTRKVTRKILTAAVFILVTVASFIVFGFVNGFIEWKYRMLDMTTLSVFWISQSVVSMTFSFIFSPKKKKGTTQATLDSTNTNTQ
eukprot:TRINITY_DN2605_c0_g1_i1.p1 TRINITY_DN2605_c0_g1~~TRINITY_DN2605_c0_g1_i1.p1  ORF type:complete len:439 (-),score=60.25 TRINITY_DN2605_c0_g1_i1:54-1370(-)